MTELPVDRHRAVERAAEGEFDLVVFSDIWRSFGIFAQLGPQLAGLPSTRVAVIDGADRREMYPYAGKWWRCRSWWFLPRAKNATYFKREISEFSYWTRAYLMLPPQIARRLGLMKAVRPVSISIPPDEIVATPPEKDQLLARDIVDPEMRDGRGVSVEHYPFESADEYIADLRRSQFGITLKRAGWDALRHYEQAAAGCVPCFRDLDQKPPRCAPYGLDATNCVPYSDVEPLMRRLRSMSPTEYAALQHASIAWARSNSTIAAAERFLGELGMSGS
ncbi:MAG: glycosyltransferase family 1 protein [Solirubrobacterales bacterium]